MAKLTHDEILHLAQLARLELSDEEVVRLQNELASILDYVEQLNQVDVTGHEPTTQVSGLTNVMRDDEPIEYQSSKDGLLKLAPASKDGHIEVKRMVT